MRYLKLALFFVVMSVLLGGTWTTTPSPSNSIIPGLTGKEGDSSTVTYLTNMKKIQFPPQFKQTIYVSTSGNDSNDGLSMGKAYLTLDKVGDVITETPCGIEVIFNGGDTWVTNDTHFGACTAGADDCGLGIIADNGSGSASGVNCADTDSVAVWIHTDDGSLATIDCTNDEPEGGAVISATQAADGGWIVVENIHTTGCSADAFSVSGDGGKLFVNGGGGYSDVAGASNNVLTSHADSKLIAVNVNGNSLGGASAAPAGGFIDESDVTLVNVNLKSDGTTAEGCVDNTGSNSDDSGPNLSWIRGSCGFMNASAVTHEGISIYSDVTAADITVRTANVSFDLANPNTGAQSGCIDVSRSGSTNQTIVVETYNSSCTSDGDGWVVSTTPGAGSTLTWTLRDTMADVVTNQAIDFRSSGVSTGLVLNIYNSLIDQDDNDPNDFRLDGTLYDTIALFFTGCGSTVCPVQELTDIAAGPPWDQNTNLFCALGEECEQAGGDAYSFELVVPLPAFVLGSEVERFTNLGGPNSDIGR